MSNSEGDSTENTQENMEIYCIPRKFVFDVPDSNSKSQKELSSEKRALKKSLEAEKYMPYIFNFPEPTNYRESYTQITKTIIAVYNHIRLLIVEEYFEELKHVIREFKIEQPSDCLTMLKEVFAGCCEKLQSRPKDKDDQCSSSVRDYEELLQKAEAKIRILIRNEQIFRLNFDILSQKCEDSDKSLQVTCQELEAAKKSQEALTKENLELQAKLWQKEEELKKAQKERDSVEKRLKEAAANLNAIDNIEQVINIDNKHSSTTWNQQILNMLVKDTKAGASEVSSRYPANYDGKACANAMKQSSNKLTPTERVKNDKKTNVSGNGSFLSTSSGNLNKGNIERLKNSLVAEFKKHMNATLNGGSNRAALNASLDVVLNKSTEQSQERGSVNATTLSAKKRSSQQFKTGQSHDQIRVKPPVKERKLGEYTENKEACSMVANKGVLQKIMNQNTKNVNVSTRPTSTGKSRGSPLVSRSRVVQVPSKTEQSPDNKSQESRISYTYTSNQSTDLFNGQYSGNVKKKSLEPRENRSYVKGGAKSSLLIKNMIAEHLSKKLNGNK